MVKLAKGAKTQAKPKKAAPPPPKDMEDSEEEEDMEEEDSSDEEMELPVKKTPAKKAATPAKATSAKAATPAKATVTPGKKGATPAGAKNGKQAKKQESEDEEDDSDDEAEDPTPITNKPVAKKAVAKKEESEDDEEDDEDESEEEKPVSKKPLAKNPPAKVTPAKKPTGKKQESEDEEDESEEEKPVAKNPPAKKPAGKKQESDDEESEDDEDEPMEVAPALKGKKTVPAKADEDDDDDDDDEDDDEDDDDDDEEDEDDEEQQVSAKRKKEMPKTKNIPEAKKAKTDTSEGLSIFIGNLNASKDFDELKDALREFFSKKNLTVQDVRIGNSKKFGYVDFSSEEEVEQALKLSGKKILGSEVKIEKAMAFDKNKNAENKKERDSRTLFVKNIPYSTTAEELQEIFENAKDIRIPTGKDGANKGIAYVEFSNETEATKALEEKQGAEIEGRSIFVDFTGEKSQNSGSRRVQGGDSKVLVVNNLSYSATEDSLREVFEKATSIRIPQNQGRAKGFAFIEFSSVEDAKEAMDSCNNTEIEGRSIRLEFSQGSGPQGGRGGSAQSKTLFVRGLSEDTTEETLKEAFDGSVNARIVTDRDTGASKGFGFVDFSTAEDAKAAKEAMEDGEIDGSKVTLDFAKPKGDSQRGGRGGFGRGGGFRGGRGGFGGRGGGRGRGGFGGRGGGGFRGGNQGQGKKIRFDD
uniref:Nucleolin n=1 Tax=Xenopus tropicalis TaxID=8364 RepID=F6WH78_XENTR